MYGNSVALYLGSLAAYFPYPFDWLQEMRTHHQVIPVNHLSFSSLILSLLMGLGGIPESYSGGYDVFH